MGKVVPEFGIEQVREVIDGQYRIVYHILDDQIDILALIHCAQDWRPTRLLGETE